MRSVIVSCSLLAATLCAQSPSSDGVFSLLRARPFVAEVSSVSTSPGGYKLSLRAMDGGTSSFEHISSNPTLEQQFVAQLQSGRRYAFPQCLIDYLGLDETVRLIRSLPTSSSFLSAHPSPQTGLLDLGHEQPFRATVLDQGIGETSYSMVLQAANSQLHNVSGTFASDTVKRIAEKLQRGVTYEFPAALDDVLLTKAERAAKARPKSPAVAVLGRYIGSWSGTLEDDPTAKILMNCHWLANGTGIWRELTFEHQGSADPPTLDIARITLDAGSKSYSIADPAPGSPAALASSWDEDTQTFTTTLPSDAKGQMRMNKATFTTEARIDWKTETLDAGGQVLASRRGSYIRISKTVPAVKLPPSKSKAAFTANPTSGSRNFISKTTLIGPLAQSQTPPSQTPPPVTYTNFFKLRNESPFRGRITHVEIDAQSITATLERVDLRQFSIHHSRRDEGWDQALLIAKRFTPDSIYEFPAALAEDYQPPPAGFVPMPATDAMRALSPFIGEWSMHWTLGPGRDRSEKITVHYFWSNDGTGLWREVHLPAGMSTGNAPQVNARALAEVTLTRYDPATRSYYETYPSPEVQKNIGWDPQTKTYSFTSIPHQFNPDIRHTSTRRIISADRIEFHSKVSKVDGTVLNESAGYYKRIVP